MSNDLYIKVEKQELDEWVRPSDWLPLPTVNITDDRCVLLVAVMEDDGNFITFNFTTSTGQYQVDWGDGNITLHNSGTNAEWTYDYNNPLLVGTECSRGYRQTIISITPVTGELRTANFQVRPVTVPPQTTTFNYSTRILDVLVSLPYANTGQSLVFCSSGNIVEHNMTERFRLINNGNITLLNSLFNFAQNLRVVFLDTKNCTNIGAFFNCINLIKIEFTDTSSLTSILALFSGCRSLVKAPFINTTGLTIFDNLFNGCASLVEPPLYDMSSATRCTSMFQGCTALTTIPPYNVPNVINIASMVRNCPNLTEFKFNFFVTATANLGNLFNGCRNIRRIDMVFRVSISLINLCLSRQELVKIFTNLLDRTSLSSQNIDITGNWGASALSIEDRAIATDKNWTITG